MSQRRAAHLATVLQGVQHAWTAFVAAGQACSRPNYNPTPEECDKLAIAAAQLESAVGVIGERAQEYAAALLDLTDE